MRWSTLGAMVFVLGILEPYIAIKWTESQVKKTKRESAGSQEQRDSVSQSRRVQAQPALGNRSTGSRNDWRFQVPTAVYPPVQASLTSSHPVGLYSNVYRSYPYVTSFPYSA